MNEGQIVGRKGDVRSESAAVIGRLRGTGRQVRRAQILAKADAEGRDRADARIVEPFGCRPRAVEELRQAGVAARGERPRFRDRLRWGHDASRDL
ncbi:hypothetical protein OJF2_08860 [Aquisphaera giovannonii]|uniref:Uncharacterized protein n=1 Tax=Aquisphaera giovannonii TaxID=406548 RepID=A0A5B9VVF3_9BACT|nr:hypothetical protein OJF2_08860 [Aquisphaera giovannonii]